MRRLLPLPLAAAVLVTAAPALADQTIRAQPVNTYATPSVTMAQGEKLTFDNGDIATHTVTENVDSHRKFDTNLVDPGGSAFVEGSQYLTTGTYKFFCSVHPFMTGTLTVSSDGTPVPRVNPSFRLKVSSASISAVRKAGSLSVKVTLGGAALVKLSAKSGSKTIASGSQDRNGSGTQKLKLNSAGKKLFKHANRVSVKVSGTAKGESPKTFGKTAGARASKTLR